MSKSFIAINHSVTFTIAHNGWKHQEILKGEGTPD